MFNPRRLLNICLLFLFIAILFNCSKQEPIIIRFFYIEACPTCETYQEAERLSKKLLRYESENKQADVEVINLFFDMENKAEFEEYFQIPEEGFNPPLLFINNQYYQGYDEITSVIEEL